MNKLLTISALAAIATATLPSRRQIDFDPPDASSFPPDCLDAIKEIFKSAPPEPTPVASFTSNFYKTVSRTATATDEECAWITNMPDDVAQSYLDWADDIAEWMADMREDKKGPEISDECNEVFVGTDRGTCTKEWAQFRNDKGGADGSNSEDNGGKADNGTETGDKEDPEDEKDPDAAATGFDARAYAATAVLVSFVGAIALL